MAQTVIGFFKEASDVQKAVDKLDSKGISRQYVDVTKGEYLDGTADREGRNTNKVTDFFNKLFGHDSDDARRYSTVGQSNVSIVTVHAPSWELAEEAADVLDDCGAIDVDEHASQSGYTSNNSNARTDEMTDFSNGNGTINRGENNFEEHRGQDGVRRRSQIIDRSLDENHRLRGE